MKTYTHLHEKLVDFPSNFLEKILVFLFNLRRNLTLLFEKLVSHWSDNYFSNYKILLLFLSWIQIFCGNTPKRTQKTSIVRLDHMFWPTDVFQIMLFQQVSHDFFQTLSANGWKCSGQLMATSIIFTSQVSLTKECHRNWFKSWGNKLDLNNSSKSREYTYITCLPLHLQRFAANIAWSCIIYILH